MCDFCQAFDFLLSIKTIHIVYRFQRKFLLNYMIFQDLSSIMIKNEQKVSSFEPLDKMTQIEKDQQLLNLRKYKEQKQEEQRLRSNRLKQAFNMLPEIVHKIGSFIDSAVDQSQDLAYNYVKTVSEIIPYQETRQEYLGWVNCLYTKYKKSNWKWVIRMLICALVFFIFGEVILYFSKSFILDSKIITWIKKFVTLNEKQLCWLFRGACSLFGAAISLFYSFALEYVLNKNKITEQNQELPIKE